MLVLANGNEPESPALARYYMEKRSIPSGNLIVLDTTREETCSREEYDKQIRSPVEKKLRDLIHTQRIRCLVTIFGIPLRIDSIALAKTDKPVTQDPHSSILPSSTLAEETSDQEKDNAREVFSSPDSTTEAAVDSELALVLSGDYPLEGWLPNPYFLGFSGQETLLKKDEVLMVSRIDGPGAQVARRLIDDAAATEEKGLSGQACFDARWPLPKDQPVDAYALYDAAIHNAAQHLRREGRIPVTLDDRETLFGRGECPSVALYCGWYSLGQYTDIFHWQQGAVGYHIASAECTTLRLKDSRVWCRQMLEKGICATLGPVNEPYVQGFPPPDLFFATLSEGYLSLAETYLISLPYLSWQMVLVGDPLYTPFAPEQQRGKAP